MFSIDDILVSKRLKRQPDVQETFHVRTCALHHPEVKHAIGEMVIELEAAEALPDRAAQDGRTDPVSVSRLLIRVFAAKYRAVESSSRVANIALELVGGFGIFREAGLGRIFRDARLGESIRLTV